MNVHEQEFVQAVKKGDAEKIKQLLGQNRALVDSRTETGESVILLAMYHGHRGIANLLWDYGAEMNIWEAASVGASDRVQEIVNRDSGSIHALSHDGFTPLQLAAFFGNSEVVELLTARGADVNAISRNTTFARSVPILQSAVASCNAEVVRILLVRGANPNVVNEQEGTPLYLAALEGNAEMVKLLLAHGADANWTAKTGQTPLAAAMQKGHQEIVDLLRKHTAKE